MSVVPGLGHEQSAQNAHVNVGDNIRMVGDSTPRVNRIGALATALIVVVVATMAIKADRAAAVGPSTVAIEAECLPDQNGDGRDDVVTTLRFDDQLGRLYMARQGSITITADSLWKGVRSTVSPGPFEDSTFIDLLNVPSDLFPGYDPSRITGDETTGVVRIVDPAPNREDIVNSDGSFTVSFDLLNYEGDGVVTDSEIKVNCSPEQPVEPPIIDPVGQTPPPVTNTDPAVVIPVEVPGETQLSIKKLPKVFGKKPTIVWDGKSRIVKGTNKPDTIYVNAPAGRTVKVLGNGGADRIFTEGKGRVVVFGGKGSDKIKVMNKGASTINAGPGNDLVFGGSGRQTITGGPGRDRVFGGAGNDIFKGPFSKGDFINGGKGKDKIVKFPRSLFSKVRLVSVELGRNR